VEDGDIQVVNHPGFFIVEQVTKDNAVRGYLTRCTGLVSEGRATLCTKPRSVAGDLG
jgi:hypothetical protein